MSDFHPFLCQLWEPGGPLSPVTFTRLSSLPHLWPPTQGCSEMGQPIPFTPPVCHPTATEFGRRCQHNSWWGALGCLLVTLAAGIPPRTQLIIKGVQVYCLDHFGYGRTKKKQRLNSNGARFTGFVGPDRRVGWNYCSWQEQCFRICPRY